MSEVETVLAPRSVKPEGSVTWMTWKAIGYAAAKSVREHGDAKFVEIEGVPNAER